MDLDLTCLTVHVIFFSNVTYSMIDVMRFFVSNDEHDVHRIRCKHMRLLSNCFVL